MTGVVALLWKMLMRTGPPHNSAEFPLQAMSQSVAGAETLGTWIVESQSEERKLEMRFIVFLAVVDHEITHSIPMRWKTRDVRDHIVKDVKFVLLTPTGRQ